MAPQVRRQLVNLGPGRVVLLAVGGAAEHQGRDGEAFTSWDDHSPTSPQEMPMPPDLDPGELRTRLNAPDRGTVSAAAARARP